MYGSNSKAGSFDICKEWIEGTVGSAIRRYSYREELFAVGIPEFMATWATRFRRPSESGFEDFWTAPAGCTIARYMVLMLYAAADCVNGDFEQGVSTFLGIMYKVFSGAIGMLDILTCEMSFFHLSLGVSNACIRKPSAFEHGTGALHDASLKSDIWAGVLSQKTLPISSAAVLAVANHSTSLEKGFALLVIAQALRMKSAAWFFEGSLAAELEQLIREAASQFGNWLEDGSATLVEEGFREWPVLSLLSDLELSSTVAVRAMGRPEPDQPLVQFHPGVINMAVLPIHETLSNHNRLSGKFHCSVDYFLEVERWSMLNQNDLSRRLVTVEIGCALADCLLWAAKRLDGRIRAIGFEGEMVNVATARRSIEALQLEGTVDVLHRTITGRQDTMSSQWTCIAGRFANCFLSSQRPSGRPGDRRVHSSPARTTTVDAELDRLGLRFVDILLFSVPVNLQNTYLDFLHSANQTLQYTRSVIIEVSMPSQPEVLQQVIDHLVAAGFTDILDPTEKECSAGFHCPLIARRPE